MADSLIGRLRMTSPLAAMALPEGPGYRLSSWPFATLHVLAVIGDALPDPLRAWGFDSLPALLEAREAAGVVLMRLAPDELLIVAEEGVAPAAKAEFFTQNLIEISHNLVGLRLEGSHVERLLAVSCPIDVHERAFPVGMSTRTLCGKFEIVIWRRSTNEFRLLIARSSAIAFSVYVGLAISGAPV